MNRLLLSVIFTAAFATGVNAQNWPQFRGPSATGVVEGQPAAVTWDAAKSLNTRWKIEVPGLAHSSPVVWGDKVFVSTAVTSGAKDETRFGLYGDVAPVKDDPKHTWKVYALDKQTGKILWERIAYDIQKDSFIAAYSLKNGKLVWKTPREEISSWGTPTIYEGKTRAELITNGSKAIRGYDPATGKELWRLTPNSEVTTPTPFVAHDLIFVTSGYSPIQPIYAIRPGATGDISLAEGKDSNTFIAWSKKRGGPYMPTPVVYGDHLYTCSNQGVLTAYNAHTGERIYQERLGGKGGAFTASPVASDGKLYLSSEDGDVFVVKAGPKYELLATNPVGEVMMATPAISSGLVIVRGVKHLFAFGAADATKAKVAKAGN